MMEHSPMDKLIGKADIVLRTLSGTTTGSGRQHPAAGMHDKPLSEGEKKQSARLMRVNHAGEIAAQGLYHGQAFSARDDRTRDRMMQNAHEEADHLYWCRTRIKQLGGRTSLLAPLWYCGSLAIGVAAGLFGDRWNHAFVKETEEQVVAHLQSHLNKVSPEDKITLAIIAQIKTDEAGHAESARQAGASDLPAPVKKLMRSTAKIMTRTAYRI